MKETLAEYLIKNGWFDWDRGTKHLTVCKPWNIIKLFDTHLEIYERESDEHLPDIHLMSVQYADPLLFAAIDSL